MATPVERRNVYTLGEPWHPVLRAYALAVREMRERPPSDPTSWAYQAEVHGVGLPTDPPPDDFPKPMPTQLLVLSAMAPLVPLLLRADPPGRSGRHPRGGRPRRRAWALPYWNHANGREGGSSRWSSRKRNSGRSGRSAVSTPRETRRQRTDGGLDAH